MEEKEVVKAEPTVEQLKQAVNALKSQNTQLMYQLQNVNMTNLFKRLDYLFKVVENYVVLDSEFVEKCVAEIKELMTPSESEVEDKD